MSKSELFIGKEGRKISVRVENLDGKGLVFCMPGHGSSKDKINTKAFQKTFVEKDFKVVSFDPRGSIGKSQGDFETSTPTGYYEDLCEVIDWAKNQEWYEEPFILQGHSLGGQCITTYAAENPKEVKAIAPIATVISHDLRLEMIPKHLLEEYERTGYKSAESTSKPGEIKKFKWNEFIKDSAKFDLRNEAPKINIPVILIVGEKDDLTPPKHQKIVYKLFKGNKELHIIKGADHKFKPREKLDEVHNIMIKWIEKVKK